MGVQSLLHNNLVFGFSKDPYSHPSVVRNNLCVGIPISHLYPMLKRPFSIVS